MLSMIAGSGLVFSLVYVMNELNQPPVKEEDKKVAHFNVEKKPPKPPPEKKPQKAQKKMQASAAPQAPVPNLGSAIGAAGFKMPGLEETSLTNSTDKLLGKTQEQMVMTEDAVDQKPEPQRTVPPKFPDSARRKGVEGHVTLQVLINQNGEVERTRVREAQPSGVFEQAAVAAVQQWRFRPARYHGNPVKLWATQTIRFRLN